MSDFLAEEAAISAPEWGKRQVVRITHREKACRERGRVWPDDRMAYSTAPGVICTFPAGHEGPHYDAYDGVFWEDRQSVRQPAAVPISDVPLGLWPSLEDFEEDLTDAAA